jgi:hypothetical protein
MTKALLFLTMLLTVPLCVYGQSPATPSNSNATSAQNSAPSASNIAATQSLASGNPNVARAANESGPPEGSQSSQNPTARPNTAHRVSIENNAETALPQTSTILPLLGLIGLGSLIAGLFARR